MSDTPTPPEASGETPAQPTPPASPAKRPWTILGRLSQAVREQNWFAVVLELVIVVLGVVIGFQVTSWGQDRSDAATERAYLRQLAADLAETERVVAGTDEQLASALQATHRLLRAFREPERPTPDSLAQWINDVGSIRTAVPVMGTVQALIATGDLALIRDDSLRSAVTAYAQKMDAFTLRQDAAFRRQMDAREEVSDLVDIWEVQMAIGSPAELDWVARGAPDPEPADLVPGDLFVREARGIPSRELRRPFPISIESMLTNRAFYSTMRDLGLAHSNAGWSRRQMLRVTRALREQVEAELNR